jgi:hypothetical protein
VRDLHDNDGEASGDVHQRQPGPHGVERRLLLQHRGQFWDEPEERQYGETPIQNVAGQYSYGEKTGIDLPGEDAGYYARVDSPTIVAKEHAQDPKDYPYGGGSPGTTSRWPSAREAR